VDEPVAANPGSQNPGETKVGKKGAASRRAEANQEAKKKAAHAEDRKLDVNETSAADSEKSEPRPDLGILIKSFQGMQHTLQILTQGFRQRIREKTWARKAHARRERRRAAR
jgi:hypothetical protein